MSRGGSKRLLQDITAQLASMRDATAILWGLEQNARTPLLRAPWLAQPGAHAA